MRHDVIAEIRSLGFYFVKLLFLRKVCAKMISFGMYSTIGCTANTCITLIRCVNSELKERKHCYILNNKV